jgi:S-adenosylmethionine:tRNA ribosyltransferase-isomerase
MTDQEFEDLLKDYDYTLPEELIAQEPSVPRDNARLLIYNRADKSIQHDRFFNIGSYLPKNTVLVLNETKVVPARFTATKPNGTEVTLLYTQHDEQYLYALCNKTLADGVVLIFGDKEQHTLEVIKKAGKEYQLKPNFPTKDIFLILENYGTMPLPPYIKHSPLDKEELKQEYQTVFAKTNGSVAAPTASLHFTEELLAKLQQQGIEIVYLTLHVGLGTFAPLTKEQVETGKLHTEYFSIPKDTADKLNTCKQQGKPIIPVGSTATRALETATDASGTIYAGGSQTDIFIQPGYQFKSAQGIITNFHVPRSSLLMLVANFTGKDELMRIYQEAISNNYRFYSFGDGMLMI